MPVLALDPAPWLKSPVLFDRSTWRIRLISSSRAALSDSAFGFLPQLQPRVGYARDVVSVELEDFSSCGLEVKSEANRNYPMQCGICGAVTADRLQVPRA